MTWCVACGRFVGFGRSVVRYTEWVWWKGETLAGDFDREAVGLELYSHAGDTEADFDLFENVNVATDPANKATLAQMHREVLAQWGAVDCNGLYTSKAACDASAACAWCTSAAVPAACNTLADATALPSSVFTCDKV